MKVAVSRYHSLIVALHWLVAVLIVSNLVAGKFLLDDAPNTADKLPVLRAHMTIGLIVLALTIVRLPVRMFTAKPAIPHRSRALKWLAVANHWLLYLVVLSTISTGLGVAAFANLWPLLRGEQVDLPVSFEKLEPFIGHQFFVTALAVLILLHLAGVAYHWLVHRENILPRMWFGARAGDKTP